MVIIPIVPLHFASVLPAFWQTIRKQDQSFWYDFGADWKSKVELKTITPADSKLSGSTVLESHEKSPEQYRDYEDC